MTRFTLPDGQTVFDPRGRVTAEPQSLAGRLATLDNVRLGVLDNSKWNASKLLRRTIAALQLGHQLAEVRWYVKDSFSKPAPTELIDRIARETDAVVTAVGD